MNEEQLLAEVEDVLRSMPPRETARHRTEENLSWLGRVAAVLKRWDPSSAAVCDQAISDRSSLRAFEGVQALDRLSTMLHEARSDLRMQLGQGSVVVSQGQVFDYFDGLRKVVEMARSEAFFVDPYLDADFVTRYLPFVATGVRIRLLGYKKMATLEPAVDTFAQQASTDIQLRSSSGLHDRFVFIDQSACYLSGASFKDGAKNAPAVLTQIIDAFPAMWDTYERLWADATV